MLGDKPLIEHTYVQTKCPESGYWYDAVFYVHVDNAPGFYARTIQNFMSNFEDVENIVET